MEDLDHFIEKLEQVLRGNSRYKFEAYSFVLAALHHTVSRLDQTRHVTGRELLEGIRDYALAQYGRLARTVLNYWGVKETLDFGQIVFALVDAGILRKQPEDSLDDFRDVYKFEDAFDKSYKIEEAE